jgi:hypothetical protein
VGKVGNKETMHKRLLERGVVGDFVLAESERSGLSLVCKIADGRLSFPHIITADEAAASSPLPAGWTTPWQVQMEGSKHVLKSVYHLLEHIAPLARTPARELVVDSPNEDTFVRKQKEEQVYDVATAWGCRTIKRNGGGVFKDTDTAGFDAIYDMATVPRPSSDGASAAVYDVAVGAKTVVGKHFTAPAPSDDLYDFGVTGDIYDPATMASDPVYALPEPVRRKGDQTRGGAQTEEAVYALATTSISGGDDDLVYAMAAGSGKGVAPKRCGEEQVVYDVAANARPR